MSTADSSTVDDLARRLMDSAARSVDPDDLADVIRDQLGRDLTDDEATRMREMVLGADVVITFPSTATGQEATPQAYEPDDDTVLRVAKMLLAKEVGDVPWSMVSRNAREDFTATAYRALTLSDRALRAELDQLREYCDTTRHHQDAHAAAVRELERTRADIRRLVDKVDTDTPNRTLIADLRQIANGGRAEWTR